MRFIIYGAGGVGGVVGGRLAQHGHEVVLIARGAHLEVLGRDGLRLEDPDGVAQVPVDAVGHPSALRWQDDDVVLLAMKSQHTAGALADLLAAGAPADLPVLCLQNGVANERRVLRQFARTYAVCVMLPAEHLEPGVVRAYSAPVTGNLDLGRYPAGADDLAVEIGAALSTSGFSSLALDDIMRWKHTKLLMNLGNVIEAAVGRDGRAGELATRVRVEGEAVLRAAGIPYATWEEDAERRKDGPTMKRVAGELRDGGSTWQSLARGADSIETDDLNGEIVLQARLAGTTAPVNEMLQRLGHELVATHAAPGSFTEAELLARL
jgi:2-dehydropantoate 2-reductase